MAPCPTCGGGGLTDSGHCPHCGTFRGWPVPLSAQSSPGQSVTSPTAPPQQPWTRRHAVPLFVASVAALVLVLVVGVGVIIIGRIGASQQLNAGTGGIEGAGGLTPTPTTEADGGPQLDECVIGSWQMVSHRETMNVSGRGTGEVELVGTGSVVELRADGTGRTNYGRGTRFEGSLLGLDLSVVISGVVDFSYGAENGTVAVEYLDSDASTVAVYLGQEVQEEFVPESGISSYTCSGDRMTQRTDEAESEYERLRE